MHLDPRDLPDPPALVHGNMDRRIEGLTCPQVVGRQRGDMRQGRRPVEEHRRPRPAPPLQRPGVVDEDPGVDTRPFPTAQASSDEAVVEPCRQHLAAADHTGLLPEQPVECALTHRTRLAEMEPARTPGLRRLWTSDRPTTRLRSMSGTYRLRCSCASGWQATRGVRARGAGRAASGRAPPRPRSSTESPHPCRRRSRASSCAGSSRTGSSADRRRR